MAHVCQHCDTTVTHLVMIHVYKQAHLRGSLSKRDLIDWSHDFHNTFQYRMCFRYIYYYIYIHYYIYAYCMSKYCLYQHDDAAAVRGYAKYTQNTRKCRSSIMDITPILYHYTPSHIWLNMGGLF